MKSIPFCNTLLSEMKFPEMYYSCDKNENNMSVLILPRCILFYGVLETKLNEKFSVQIPKQVLFVYIYFLAL